MSGTQTGPWVLHTCYAIHLLRPGISPRTTVLRTPMPTQEMSGTDIGYAATVGSYDLVLTLAMLLPVAQPSTSVPQ
eukprot:2005489-Rhodomonas_salina.6